MTPFRRDGHLTDLALDMLVEDGSLEGTEAHLASCATCRDRLEAAAAAELPANPFLKASSEGGMPLGASEVGPVDSEPVAQPVAANRPWAMLALLACAAVALLVASTQLPGGEGDGIRIKGSGLALQVFRDEGDHSERLRNGAAIAPGDRLGFRVRNREPGHLMILGIDARDEAYLCYPQGRDGDSMPVDAAPKAVPLPEAIRMDDTPGTEQLIAVFCESPFSFDTMAEALLEDALPDGCVADEVDLEKR